MYTANEITVLDHFFTNHTENVYCAKDTIPSELWSYLVGGASRSHLPLRDRFLAIYKDMHKTSEAYDKCMDEMASSIRGLSDVDFLTPAIRRATKFMNTWGVTYGHSSLKDSCVDRIIVDRVSILGAKAIEETSLGAFQEKSTRYMDFSNAGFVMPSYKKSDFAGFQWCGQDFAEAATTMYNQSIRVYLLVTEAAFKHYLAELNPDDFTSTKAMENTARAKAFDVARYCLMPCAPTALGFTMPTRETERHVSSMLASDNLELAGLARQMLEEAKQINPGLLTHVTPNAFTNGSAGEFNIEDSKYDYLFSTLDESYEDYRTHGLSAVVHVNEHISVQIPSWLDLYASIAASIVKKANKTNLPWLALRQHFVDILLSGKRASVIELIADRLASRGPHDPLPQEFAVCQFIMDIDMDFGAFRDLQRHRVGMQLRSSIAPDCSPFVPYLLQNPTTRDLVDALDAYNMLSAEIAAFHAAVYERDPVVAEYFALLGHSVGFTYMCDFRQLVYMCELRSTPQGHESYRSVVQAIWSVFDSEAEKYPELYKLFRVNMTKNTDRRAQENRASEKLAALQAQEQ
jgi:thymidylate synthase ThyX